MYCPSCNHPNPVYVDDYCTKCGLAMDGSGNKNPTLVQEAADDEGGEVIRLSDGCRIVLLESSLVFKDRGNGRQVEIPREEVPARLERMGLAKRSPSFFIHVPKPKRFTLGKEDAKALLEWLGPETPAEATLQLRRRVGFNIPIGIFYLVTAFSNVWWLSLAKTPSVPIRSDDRCCDAFRFKSIGRRSLLCARSLRWQGLLLTTE